MKNQIRAIVLILILIIIALSVGYNSLNEKILALESEIVSEYDMQDKLYIDGKLFERSNIILIDDDYYINYLIAKEVIEETIELSNSGKRIYVDVNKEFVDFGNVELNEYIADNIIDINIPIIENDGVKFIPIEILSRVLQFDYDLINNDFWILTHNQSVSAVGKPNLQIFINENLNIKKEKIEKENNFYAIKINNSYFIANDTYLGYVNIKDIIINENDKSYYNRYINQSRSEIEKPLYLVWDQINSHNESLNFNDNLTEVNANIISPTFLELNINGIIINISDLDYVRWAHDNDLEVWVLVSNSFNTDWTHEMLSNPVLVDRFIAQLGLYATLYEFDGINIDFENVYLEDKQLLNEFVRKLSLVTESMELPLSMDVTVPEGSDQWSKVFDRATLGKYVDYIMVMAYDEYWASSPVSGPVASIPWTINGLEAVLELVDSDKVVLGIPGYMRVWKDYQNSNDSSVLSIKNRDAYLLENEFEVEYLSELMINYSEKKINGVMNRIWIEDEISLKQRIEMLETYSLPGIALWRRGFFDDETEKIFTELLK